MKPPIQLGEVVKRGVQDWNRASRIIENKGSQKRKAFSKVWGMKIF